MLAVNCLFVHCNQCFDREKRSHLKKFDKIFECDWSIMISVGYEGWAFNPFTDEDQRNTNQASLKGKLA